MKLDIAGVYVSGSTDEITEDVMAMFPEAETSRNKIRKEVLQLCLETQFMRGRRTDGLYYNGYWNGAGAKRRHSRRCFLQ